MICQCYRASHSGNIVPAISAMMCHNGALNAAAGERIIHCTIGINARESFHHVSLPRDLCRGIVELIVAMHFNQLIVKSHD
jgi:hypothetical protein